MLDSQRDRYAAGGEYVSDEVQTLSYVDVVAAIRRQSAMFLFLAVVGLICGATFLLVFKPKFQSTATILIDTRKYPETPQANIAARVTYDSSAAIDTQVEILKSQTLARAVVEKNRLWEDPEFIAAPGGPRSIISSLFKSTNPPSNLNPVDARNRATYYLFQHLTVKRVSDTFTLDVTFESPDADSSARVANEVAEAFIDWQRNLHRTAIASAGEWLEERIKDLKEKSTSGQRSVAEFQADNNIFDMGSAGPAEERRLTDLSNQLAAARDQAKNAQSKLEQLNQLNATGHNPATDLEVLSAIEDVSSDPSIVALRQQYFEYTTKYGQLGKLLPANHEALVALRAQIQGVQTTLLGELSRVRLKVKKNKDDAEEKIKSLQSEISTTMNDSRAAAAAQVGLRQLQLSAQTYQNLYDSFMHRYAEALEAERSPAAEATIISAAEAPAARNYKKSLIIAAIFPGLALLFGGGIALLRETISRPFWTIREVESKLRLPCADVIPRVGPRLLRRAQKAFRARGDRLRRDGEKRLGLRVANPVGCYALEEPLSRFAEGIRSIKLALKISGFEASRRAIGIISALPNEGKSSVALALAAAAAKGGCRTILVDCDLRNPAMTNSWLRGEKKLGLVDVLSKRATIEDVILTDEDTKLCFIPSGLSSGHKHAGDLMANDELRSITESLKNAYDLVIMDLPPMSPVIDVAISQSFVDGYILVIEWGKTRVNSVDFILKKMPRVYENIFTAVLNKVDVGQLRKFGFYMQDYYHNKHTARYLKS
jgi:succinoglycan biosynthesis transport protein ExoP